MSYTYEVGDYVVYRMSKYSSHPGPRAQHVHPMAKGENFSYVVDKFWIVAAIEDDGQLRLRTRTGKEHLVTPSDRNLRRANFWERWFKRNRFPELESINSVSQ